MTLKAAAHRGLVAVVTLLGAQALGPELRRRRWPPSPQETVVV